MMLYFNFLEKKLILGFAALLLGLCTNLEALSQWVTVGDCGLESPMKIHVEDRQIVVQGWGHAMSKFIEGEWMHISDSLLSQEGQDPNLYESLFKNNLLLVAYTTDLFGNIYLLALDAQQLARPVLYQPKNDYPNHIKWEELDKLKDEFYALSLSHVVPLNLYLSNDKGKSWKVKDTAILGLSFNNQWSHIQDVARARVRFFCLENGTFVFSVRGIGIFRSIDQGSSWERYESGFGDMLPDFIDLVVEGNTVYGVDNAGVVWKANL